LEGKGRFRKDLKEEAETIQKEMARNQVKNRNT